MFEFSLRQTNGESSLKLEGKNVAVTGGGGFIGSHLVDELLLRCRNVTVLDNFERGVAENLPVNCEKLNVKKVNLLDFPRLESELEGVDVLFDMAATVRGNRELYRSPASIIQTNTGITLNVAKAAAKASLTRVVFSSSSCVYDSFASKVPNSEGDVALPLRSYYGWSKLIGETIYRAYHEEYGLRTGVARIFNVYGPRETLRSPHVIPEFISKARDLKSGRRTTFEILGDGNQTRSFLYVSDAVRGIMKLAESDVCEAVNLGSEIEIRVIDLATQILLAFDLDPAKVKFVHEPVNPNDMRRRAANASKAKTLLCWEPTISLKEGLTATMKWFQKLDDASRIRT